MPLETRALTHTIGGEITGADLIRCVLHHAIWDYWPGERSGHRITVRGERPVMWEGAADDLVAESTNVRLSA